MPEEPARSTGLPLGSSVKWALGTGSTSNCGVPAANVSVRVSPETAADRMAAVAGAASGAGQDDEAWPEAVQLRVTGLELGCPEVVDPPQAQTAATTRVSVSRRIVIHSNGAPPR